MKTRFIHSIAALCLFCLGGCAAMGPIVPAFTDLTPKEEHYLGRGIAANLLGKYTPLKNPIANEYLNLLGQSLASVSGEPHPFGGYCFLLLDSDEINAFAAPGGYILVTRGLVRCTKNEDELAAVLAHEIAHVKLRHGMEAVKLQEKIDAFKKLGEWGMQQALTEKSRNALKQLFGDSVNSIVDVMLVKGYSRSDEYDADELAVALLKTAGYAPAGMRTMLTQMNTRLVSRAGFGQTHPSPLDRIENLDISGDVPSNSIRQERYDLALRAIL